MSGLKEFMLKKLEDSKESSTNLIDKFRLTTIQG